MTTPQILAFAILAAMMVLFVWGRLRYDMVAVLALLAGVLTGIVPHDKAFSGFSDDIVIIVASALVVSAAVAHSGVIETLLRRRRAGVARPRRVEAEHLVAPEQRRQAEDDGAHRRRW